MKKKISLLLLVLIVALMAFAGCSSDKGYTRNVTSINDLKIAMGDNLKYPTVNLDENAKFYDPDDKSFYEANGITLKPDAKNNEIILSYIPPITADELNALIKKDTMEFDKKAYRYSIIHTKNVDKVGKIEFDIYASDYTKITDSEIAKKVKLVKVADRKAKLETDNKDDKKKLDKNGEGEFFVSALATVNGKEVYQYENKMDAQVIRHFVDGANYEYSLTARIFVDKNVKGDAAIKEAYVKLLNDAKVVLDGYVNEMTK